jgi:hypothetical protein
MPQTPRDQIRQAETFQEVWMECAERFRIAEESESTNRALAIEDMEFADGQQWPDDLYNLRKIQRRPSLTINTTGMIVRRIINNMREQRPRIKVHPVGDGADIEDARIANGLIRHIENRSNAEVAYDWGGESAVRAGWGYWRILGEYIDERSFEQELRIVGIRNPLTCYIDPGAVMPDGSDMDWFIISQKMKKREFKALYPNEELNDWVKGAAGDSQHQWETKQDIRVAEYYRIAKRRDELLKLSDGRDILRSEWDKGRQAFELANISIAKDAFGDEISRPTERRQVEWYRITGRKTVQKRKIPGRWIPVVRCEGNALDLNGDIRRKGVVRDLKDPARMKNYWATAKTEKLALSSKAPWVMAEGMDDGHPEWEDANQKPYSVLRYKPFLDGNGMPIPGLAPQRQGAVEVEQGFAEASASADKDLMMVAGMPHEPGLDSPGTVVSGVALRKRQAMSDISHFQFYDNQTQAIAHTGRILLGQIPFYYSEERMQRIIGEGGVPEMVGINQHQEVSPGVYEIKHNLQVGRYDVVMDTGPGYETKRQEAAESMIDLLKTALAEPIIKTGSDIIVRNMDFPGADDLADRLAITTPEGLQKVTEQLPEQAQNIVKAMQQQVQGLQQQVQHLSLELKYKSQIEQGWMAVEREKTRTGADVKANDAALKAHQAATDTHVKAQASIAVAEIHEAGGLLQTHVKGAHDAAARKDELKAAEKAEKSNGAKNG